MVQASIVICMYSITIYTYYFIISYYIISYTLHYTTVLKVVGQAEYVYHRSFPLHMYDCFLQAVRTKVCTYAHTISVHCISVVYAHMYDKFIDNLYTLCT